MKNPSKHNEPKVIDIANLAHVSSATVSRVLNNKSYVSAKSRQKVLVAIEELGYEPNILARSLRLNKTHTIGVLVSDISNPFFAELVRGVEDIASANGYSLILCNSDEKTNKENQYLSLLRSKRVDGIIFSPSGKTHSEVRSTIKIGIPVVLVDRKIDNLDIDSILVENIEGMRIAVKHLASHGYKRIAIITGPQTSTTGEERLEGYMRGISDNNLSYAEELVMRADYSYEGAITATRQLMDLSTRPEAILVSNNLMTIGALTALSEIGVEIPKDIAIIGFDDMPWSPLLTPPLTVVSQPAYEMGNLSANILLSRISDSNESPPLKIRLGTELIIRESCGCCHEKSFDPIPAGRTG